MEGERGKGGWGRREGKGRPSMTHAAGTPFSRIKRAFQEKGKFPKPHVLYSTEGSPVGYSHVFSLLTLPVQILGF